MRIKVYYVHITSCHINENQSVLYRYLIYHINGMFILSIYTCDHIPVVRGMCQMLQYGARQWPHVIYSLDKVGM